MLYILIPLWIRVELCCIWFANECEVVFFFGDFVFFFNMRGWVFIIASQRAKNKKSKVQLHSFVSPLLCSFVILVGTLTRGCFQPM